MVFASLSSRFRLSRRWAYQPEFTYENNARTGGDYVILQSVAVELGWDARIKPYLIFGAELRFRPAQRGSFDLDPNGGFGVKMYLSKRLFAAPEVRFGSGTLLRIGAGVGYTFGGP